MATITVETLLSDVKRLVIRLQRHDTSADSLIDQAISLKKKTESQASPSPDDGDFSAADSNEDGGASQWESAALELPDGANAIPDIRASSVNADHAVVTSIQQPENRNITKLQRENKELRLLLEEHQIALDMIMTKYRERMSELIAATTSPRLRGNAEKVKQLQTRTERLSNMIDVMYEATRVEETEELLEIETISRLESENRGLRELIALSSVLNDDQELADTTCVSRQLSDEEGLNNSDQSQVGVGGMESSWF